MADEPQWASGLVLSVTGLPREQRNEVQALISSAGGRYSPNLSRRCTHLAVHGASGSSGSAATAAGACSDKLLIASQKQHKWGLRIVDLSWVVESAQARQRLDESAFAVVAAQPPAVATKEQAAPNAHGPACTPSSSLQAADTHQESVRQPRAAVVAAAAARGQRPTDPLQRSVDSRPLSSFAQRPPSLRTQPTAVKQHSVSWQLGAPAEDRSEGSVARPWPSGGGGAAAAARAAAVAGVLPAEVEHAAQLVEEEDEAADAPFDYARLPMTQAGFLPGAELLLQLRASAAGPLPAAEKDASPPPPAVQQPAQAGRHGMGAPGAAGMPSNQQGGAWAEQQQSSEAAPTPASAPAGGANLRPAGLGQPPGAVEQRPQREAQHGGPSAPGLPTEVLLERLRSSHASPKLTALRQQPGSTAGRLPVEGMQQQQAAAPSTAWLLEQLLQEESGRPADAPPPPAARGVRQAPDTEALLQQLRASAAGLPAAAGASQQQQEQQPQRQQGRRPQPAALDVSSLLEQLRAPAAEPMAGGQAPAAQRRHQEPKLSTAELLARLQEQRQSASSGRPTQRQCAGNGLGTAALLQQLQAPPAVAAPAAACQLVGATVAAAGVQAAGLGTGDAADGQAATADLAARLRSLELLQGERHTLSASPAAPAVDAGRASELARLLQQQQQASLASAAAAGGGSAQASSRAAHPAPSDPPATSGAGSMDDLLLQLRGLAAQQQAAQAERQQHAPAPPSTVIGGAPLLQQQQQQWRESAGSDSGDEAGLPPAKYRKQEAPPAAAGAYASFPAVGVPSVAPTEVVSGGSGDEQAAALATPASSAASPASAGRAAAAQAAAGSAARLRADERSPQPGAAASQVAESGGKVFGGMVAIVDPDLGADDQQRVCAALERGGGRVADGGSLSRGVTHVVCQPDSALKWLSMGVGIVSPQWVHQSLRSGRQQRCLTVSADTSRHLPAASALAADASPSQQPSGAPAGDRATQQAQQALSSELLGSKEARQSLLNQLLPSGGAAAGAGGGAGGRGALAGSGAGNGAGAGHRQMVSTPAELLTDVAWSVLDPVTAARKEALRPRQAPPEAEDVLVIPASDTEDEDGWGGPLCCATASQAAVEGVLLEAAAEAPAARGGNGGGKGQQRQQAAAWLGEPVLCGVAQLTLLLPRDARGELGLDMRSVPVPPPSPGTTVGAAGAAAGQRQLTAGALLRAVQSYYAERMSPEEQLQLLQGFPGAEGAAAVLRPAFLELAPLPRGALLGPRCSFEGLRKATREPAGAVYEVQLGR